MCLVLAEAEEGIRSSGIGFMESFEVSCRWWESNLSPLEKQPLHLTAEPSLQPYNLIISHTKYIYTKVFFSTNLTAWVHSLEPTGEAVCCEPAWSTSHSDRDQRRASALWKRRTDSWNSICVQWNIHAGMHACHVHSQPQHRVRASLFLKSDI